jgi:hypothetical protein
MTPSKRDERDVVLMESLREMIERREAARVEELRVEPIAADRAAGELKQIGYGLPLRLRYRAHGQEKTAVFRTQAPNWFGHDRRSDRACLTLLAADTFADQPEHLRVLEVGAVCGDKLVSLQGGGEFYLLTNYVDGTLYAEDLRKLETRLAASTLDLERAARLARHLAQLHAPHRGPNSRELYQRAVRDLLGSGEGIFGIVDSYPRDFADADLLAQIEELALRWRWRLGRVEQPPLCRTHGDFHPYNLLFREGTEFTALDASRGGVGDAADDLSALAVNYLFGGLRFPEAWPAGFGTLWKTFFAEYFAHSSDPLVFERMAPFCAWRLLVLASPTWYPSVTPELRRVLLSLAIHWLEGKRFDPNEIETALAAEDLALLRVSVATRVA